MTNAPNTPAQEKTAAWQAFTAACEYRNSFNISKRGTNPYFVAAQRAVEAAHEALIAATGMTAEQYQAAQK